MFKSKKGYVINVKDKKTIVYKNERSKKVAYKLRRLVSDAVMDEWSRLGEEQKNKPTLEYIKIENERSDLYRALKASICMCPGCNQTDGGMVYNAPLKHWFCTQCAQEYRDFYHKNKAIIDQGGFVGDFDEHFHSTFL
jgi:hypothetical protein